MDFTLQPNLFIVTALTIITGIALQKSLFKTAHFNSKLDKLFLPSLAYLLVSIIYVLVSNDLPLTWFSLLPINNSAEALGPQGFTNESIIALIISLVSVVINLFVWGFSLFIIIRYLIVRKKE